MAYEIKIYGEIVSTYDKHNGAKGVSLEDLQAQLSLAEGQDIKVRINSVGGDAQEGFAMYDELRRYARHNKAQVHTFAESNLASVATVIFLAGDVREVTKTLEPFVHNAQWGIEGDSRDMKAAADVLERWNDKLAKHYAEHTELSYKEARDLMNSDTYITPEEAKAMRFATKVEKVLRPVALQRFSNQLKNDKMSKDKKSVWASIKALLDGIQNKKVNAADQQVVDFYELEEDEPIEVGANATIDGKPAEGEIVMESGETYVFAAGVLTEIRPVEEEPTDQDDNADEIEALKAKLAELEGVNAALVASETELRVSNKAMRKALNNIKALQSQIVEDEPTNPTKAKAPQAKTKGSRFGAAIEKFESLNKK